MPIDYNLAFNALEGIQQPIGQNITAGLNTYNAMQDRQRAEQERAQMQSLGQFVGQEFAGGEPDYNAITGRIAEINPLKAIEMNQARMKNQNAMDIAKLKNAPKAGLDPTFLNNAASNKYQSRQLLESYKKEKNPELKKQIGQQYATLQQSYATATKPNILGLKDSTNKLKQLEILPIDQALQSSRIRELDTSMKQSQLTQQLRSGAIKDEDFISKSVKDYEGLAARDGMSLAKVSNLSDNLGKLYKMAKGGNVAAMHALNILANKGLDPDSAVLLAEADAFGSQAWLSKLQKLGAKIDTDPRFHELESVHAMTKNVLNTRMGNAQSLAQGKMDFINKQLENRGSKRRITIDEISSFARPSWEDI
jgi:hypothetical protein